MRRRLARSLLAWLLPALCLAAAQPAGALDCPPPAKGLAALRPSRDKAVNPNPGPGDLTLPMPCGLSMVLRHVCVGVGGLLQDQTVELGCNDCGRQGLGFMESRYQTAIAGSLTLPDLPESWRRTLAEQAAQGDGRCPPPQSDSLTATYYLMGKYEVSRLQWKAVMGAGCPQPGEKPSADDLRPQTNISRQQAQEFCARYTTWLLEHHPDKLPRFPQGRTGHLRLPTEVEWEYAARGGQRVDELTLNQEDIFPLGDRPLGDYGIFHRPGEAQPPQKLAWIGTKCPNPLGLHDTAGNAAEMVDTLFRYSLGFRWHGGAGGFVSKGGSYLSTRPGVLPGRREEMPLFLEDGPFVKADLGLRVVLAGIATPESRFARLKREWAQAGERPQTASGRSRAEVEIDQRGDPLEEIDRLVEASASEVEKNNLRYLRGIIKNRNVALERQRAETLQGLIRSAVFTLESVYNYKVRERNLARHVAGAREMLTGPEAAGLSPDSRRTLQEQIKLGEDHIKVFEAAVDRSVRFYVSLLKETAAHPDQVLDQGLARIRQDLQPQDPFSKTMRRRFGLVRQHLESMRRGKSVDREAVKKDILQ
jgi:hypothetical protein